MPDKKKRIPANCKGVVYFKPILTPTKAVDHRRQATMAKNVVLRTLERKSFSFVLPACGLYINFNA
jgi:hypothetical protein